MLRDVLKTTHVLGAVLFLGAGLMTAYYKVRADRSGDPAVVAWYQREIVLADWLFTVPSGVLLPISGLWLARLYGLDWFSGWVVWGIVGYAIAGLLWLPAAALQIKMRRLAEAARDEGTALPTAFHRANRAWLLLGVPAFIISALTLWIMVSKWIPFSL